MVMVRIVGIKRYNDRHGHPRAYWRRKGAPSVPIDPSLTGMDLAAEISRLEKLHLAPKAKLGTLRQLIVDYKTRSNHWRTLRPRTRKDYERVYKWLGDGVNTPLVDITPPEMAKTRDKARDQHEVKFANQVMTTLGKVFQFGVEDGQMRENPCLGLARARLEAVDENGEEILAEASGRGNRPYSPAEAIALLDNAPPKLLPAIAAALFGCLREGDVVALSKSAPKDRWLTTLQGKSRRAGKPARPVTVYICDDWQAILDGIPANKATTICVKENGAPWTLEGFKTAWGRFRDKMELAEKIQPGGTFHGLRHTGPTILEDNGYEESQTKHLLGHGPRSVSGHYGMTAERKALLKEMALVVESAIRKARGNVVRIGNHQR